MAVQNPCLSCKMKNIGCYFELKLFFMKKAEIWELGLVCMITWVIYESVPYRQFFAKCSSLWVIDGS
jgi:hypothetical protein